jgi:hypothetical protein
VKVPKTYAGVRRLPIHPALAPLLEFLRQGADAEDRILFPNKDQGSRSRYPEILRENLRLAGIAREELFNETKTHMAISLRSLRDTGLTWSAIAGVDLVKLQRRAGHTTIAMTLAYVKEAEEREALTGSVFPSLEALFPGPPPGPLAQPLDQTFQVPLKPLRKLERDTGFECECRVHETRHCYRKCKLHPSNKAVSSIWKQRDPESHTRSHTFH